MRVLGGFGFEELASSRRVEIQITYFECRAASERSRRDRAQLRAVCRNRPRVLVIGMAARKRQPRNRSNARERFAAETETRYALKIVERADFARGVSRQSKRQFLARDAASVID